MVAILYKEDRSRIVKAIREAEENTSGEIRVHLKPTATRDCLAEAKRVFHKLRMHKTKNRNGVLILIVPKSRQFAIIGDRGIHDRVGDGFWHNTRDVMVSYFKTGQIADGIIAGIANAGQRLKAYFPKSDGKNELPNTITEG